MQTYLKGLDLWEVEEENYVFLSKNLVVIQIKIQKKKRQERQK